ncbi:hypothetical protein BKA81DRAFT_399736 [Phyllosticta paracitricarpa]
MQDVASRDDEGFCGICSKKDSDSERVLGGRQKDLRRLQPPSAAQIQLCPAGGDHLCQRALQKDSCTDGQTGQAQVKEAARPSFATRTTLTRHRVLSSDKTKLRDPEDPNASQVVLRWHDLFPGVLSYGFQQAYIRDPGGLDMTHIIFHGVGVGNAGTDRRAKLLDVKDC